jgi:hypothetical protein
MTIQQEPVVVQFIYFGILTRVPPTVQNTPVKSLKKLWSWPLTNDFKKEHELFSLIMKNHCVMLQNPHACRLVSYKVILWPWPFTNEIGSRSWSRSWHFFGSSVTSLWNIIPIHELAEKLWLGQCQKTLCV